MSHAPIPSEPFPQADQATDSAALRLVIQSLEADNQRLREQVVAVASANIHAAALMVELHEAQAALAAQHQQLQEQSAALAMANAHAAELMVELHEAQQQLQAQNAQFELHNRFIRQTFGRYLTNEIVASLLDSPTGLALGGEKRQVTLRMSDLRGFTTLSEYLHPEDKPRHG
jgi:hypothetical protein